MSNAQADDQCIKAVHGLAEFHGMDAEWTEAEMAPIVAAMTEINEGARRYFGCYASEPQGIKVGWDFYKRALSFGAPYWSRLWT